MAGHIYIYIYIQIMVYEIYCVFINLKFNFKSKNNI